MKETLQYIQTVVNEEDREPLHCSIHILAIAMIAILLCPSAVIITVLERRVSTFLVSVVCATARAHGKQQLGFMSSLVAT